MSWQKSKEAERIKSLTMRLFSKHRAALSGRSDFTLALLVDILPARITAILRNMWSKQVVNLGAKWVASARKDNAGST